MINAKVKSDFKFKPFKPDMSRELNRGSDVIKRDIQEHIANQLRIDNESRQAELSPVTILAKKAKGGISARHATDILIETENLWRNQRITRATPSHQTAKIEIGSTRASIGATLQEGTVNMPERPFFGISAKGEAGVMRLIELEIERALKAL